MKKVRSSTIIALGFVAATAGVVFGYRAVTNYMIMRTPYGPVQPSRVNIVGVDPGAGYRIIVANEIAQLVETQGDFNGDQGGDQGATDGAIKKRIPVREMLGSLRGDPKSVGSFVMTMNNLSENDLPPVRVVWPKAKLERALAGDPTLQAQLESDLNVKLDGTPLPQLRLSSLENGIVVETPVTLTVPVNGKPTPVSGPILQAYKPRLMKDVEAQYADKPNVDTPMRKGYYVSEAQKVLEDPKRREDVRATLTALISDATSKSRAVIPERILRSAFVVVNDSYITKASYNTYDVNDGKKMHDLTIDLNDQGRRRLWQFSKNRIGDQLLLVADGVAIAAPRIQHELAQGELTITKMPDEVMVRTAVDAIEGHRTASR